jgi:peptidoglycan/xylan/chitin deacetylase (PgdA/CDA1 family)
MRLRSAIRRGLNAALARAPLKPTPGRVLLYHRIEHGREPSMYVDPGLFRMHMERLATSGLRGTAVGDALDAGFPDGVVAITFDDGYASVASACEVLAARGWGATLFIVPAWCDERRHGILGWAELRDLARSGFEIAAHGSDHAVLADPAPIAALRRARTTIEDRIGARVRGLSYPHGIAPRRARAEAAAVYDYACTTAPRRNSRGTPRHALGRNEIMGTDTPSMVTAKLAGSDDWMAAVRTAEHALRYGP